MRVNIQDKVNQTLAHGAILSSIASQQKFERERPEREAKAAETAANLKSETQKALLDAAPSDKAIIRKADELANEREQLLQQAYFANPTDERRDSYKDAVYANAMYKGWFGERPTANLREYRQSDYNTQDIPDIEKRTAEGFDGKNTIHTKSREKTNAAKLIADKQEQNASYHEQVVKLQKQRRQK